MATSENISRTVYGAAVQTYLFTGQPFELTANTTLNEKWSVQSGVLPSSGATPTLKYLAVGNGGHTMTAGTDGVYLITPLQHDATDAALFKHLPFVLVLPTEDLTTAQQASYAMRTTLTVNNVQYVAYYLKRIDYSTTEVQMQYKSVASDGTVTTSTFTPTSANLSPTPSSLTTSGVNVETGDYATATGKITVTLSADDITALLNVVNIIYGSAQYGIISEMALVTGVDQAISVTGSNSTSYQFTEALVAQCAAFVNTAIPLQFMNDSVSVVLDIGASEPLLKSVSTTS